jgi:hypothetical protein
MRRPTQSPLLLSFLMKPFPLTLMQECSSLLVKPQLTMFVISLTVVLAGHLELLKLSMIVTALQQERITQLISFQLQIPLAVVMERVASHSDAMEVKWALLGIGSPRLVLSLEIVTRPITCFATTIPCLIATITNLHLLYLSAIPLNRYSPLAPLRLTTSVPAPLT